MAEKKPLVLNGGEVEQLQSEDTIPSSYDLPTASDTVLGGVKVGDRLSISNGVLSADSQGLITEIVKTGTATLTTAEVSGTIINNYGQSADAVLTLPTAAKGQNILVVLGTTVAKYYRIKAGTNDKIYLAGTAGTDNGYVGIASAVIGASISFAAFQTGASAYDWMATVVSGTWVAG